MYLYAYAFYHTHIWNVHKYCTITSLSFPCLLINSGPPWRLPSKERWRWLWNRNGKTWPVFSRVLGFLFSLIIITLPLRPTLKFSFSFHFCVCIYVTWITQVYLGPVHVQTPDESTGTPGAGIMGVWCSACCLDTGIWTLILINVRQALFTTGQFLRCQELPWTCIRAPVALVSNLSSWLLSAFSDCTSVLLLDASWLLINCKIFCTQ